MNRPNLLRGEELPPAPQQARSRRRCEAILEAAVARFGRDGFERASIEEIAREAGAATGGVYHFFRSKRQLLLVLMDTLLRRIDEVHPPSLSPGKVLDGIEQFLVKVFQRELPYVGVYRAWQEAALADSAIGDHDRHIRSWSRARIQGWFAGLAALPGARPRLDLKMLAVLWDSFFWGLLAQPPFELKRTAKSVTVILYHVFFLDSPKKRAR
jgi:AcrR family transcriptional regulator